MVASYQPKFTYIIPFRYRYDRILPLKRVVDWLSGFQGVEIMIVEQDEHSKIDYINFKATHVFIKSSAPFNKSWAYNVGLKRAISQTIVFGDADFLMNPMELIESLKNIEHHDCVIPTNNIINLDQNESAMDTGSIFQIRRVSQKKSLLDGISIFKKDKINQIGGWNEDFLGIGYENQFNELKVKKFLNYKEMSFSGYHIYHQSDPTPHQLDSRNIQILETFKNDQNLLGQQISQSIPRIGQSNRFSHFTV